jgi:propanediol dehydratase small subunit
MISMTTMSTSWIIIVVLSLVLAVFFEILRWHAVRPLYQRECAGIRWRRRFPKASSDEIREFLRLFVDAFGFPRKHRLRFRPEDRVMDLYHALNPPNWSAGDNMELESLLEDFQRRYHVDLAPLWREDLTLADIFAHTSRKQ